jgi:hypothetical protein
MSLSYFARGLRLAASLSRPSHTHRFSASRSLAFSRPTPPFLYSPLTKNNQKKNSEKNKENDPEDEHETDHGDEPVFGVA